MKPATNVPYRWALKFTIAALCGFYFSFTQAESFNGKVVDIADGDTLTVLAASRQQHKIRRSTGYPSYVSSFLLWPLGI